MMGELEGAVNIFYNQLKSQHSIKRRRIARRAGIGVVSLVAVGLIAFLSHLYSTKPLSMEEKAKRGAKEVYGITLNRYKNILKYGTTPEEREELPTLLASLADVYDGLNVNENDKVRVDGLKARIEDSIKLYDDTKKAEQLFAEANSLVSECNYNNANSRIKEALALFPENKGYKELDTKVETLIVKLAEDDNKFDRIKQEFDEIDKIGPDERKELGYLLASLNDLYKFPIDETRRESIQTVKDDIKVKIDDYDAEQERLSSYYSRFAAIKENIKNENFYGIDSRVRSLASALEKEDSYSAKKLLEEVKDVSYTKKEYVKAKYEERRNIPATIWGGVLWTGVKIIALPWDLAGWAINRETLTGDVAEDFWDGTKTQVKVEDAHYKKIKVNPCSGTETVIDKLPVD